MLTFTKRDWADLIASEWIESKTEYAYNPSTKLFNQPALAHSILSSLLTTNPTTLSSIKSKAQIGKYKPNTSISEICKAPKSAESVEILEGVLKTLEECERPVLVAVDEVQALFSTSGVRTPDFRILESYHLSTPNLFLDYLTGKKSFVCPPSPLPSVHYPWSWRKVKRNDHHLPIPFHPLPTHFFDTLRSPIHPIPKSAYCLYET